MLQNSLQYRSEAEIFQSYIYLQIIKKSRRTKSPACPGWTVYRVIKNIAGVISRRNIVFHRRE